jgi:hypothetical protein
MTLAVAEAKAKANTKHIYSSSVNKNIKNILSIVIDKIFFIEQATSG